MHMYSNSSVPLECPAYHSTCSLTCVSGKKSFLLLPGYSHPLWLETLKSAHGGQLQGISPSASRSHVLLLCKLYSPLKMELLKAEP